MIKITKHHLDTLREVSVRLAVLANSLPDNRVSFETGLSTKPYAVRVKAFEWSTTNPHTEILEMDGYDLYLERDPEEVEHGRIKLLAKVSEWEEKYGLQ